MLVQWLLVSFLLVLLGSLTCLAVATDPNAQPNPQRQRLLPIGLAMLFAGVVALCGIVGLDYLGDALDLEPPILVGLSFLGGYGLSVILAAIVGFRIGRRRNRKLNYR